VKFYLGHSNNLSNIVNSIVSDGLASQRRRYFRDSFIESTQFLAQRDVKMVCIALQEFTETHNVSNYPVTKMDRFNKYQTTQYTHTYMNTQTHTHSHTSGRQRSAVSLFSELHG